MPEQKKELFVGIPELPLNDRDWGIEVTAPEDYMAGHELTFMMALDTGDLISVNVVPEHRNVVKQILQAARQRRKVKVQGYFSELAQNTPTLDYSRVLISRKLSPSEYQAAFSIASDPRSPQSLREMAQKAVMDHWRIEREEEEVGPPPPERETEMIAKKPSRDKEEDKQEAGHRNTDWDYSTVKLDDPIHMTAAFDPDLDKGRVQVLEDLIKEAKDLLSTLKKEKRIKTDEAKKVSDKLKDMSDEIMGVKNTHDNWPFEDAKAAISTVLHLLRQRSYGPPSAGMDKESGRVVAWNKMQADWINSAIDRINSLDERFDLIAAHGKSASLPEGFHANYERLVKAIMATGDQIDQAVKANQRSGSFNGSKFAEALNYVECVVSKVAADLPDTSKMTPTEFYRYTMEKLAPTMPPIDPEEYPPIVGLEGPFRFRDGRILYYDPKEGEYYDRKTDMYMGRDYTTANAKTAEDQKVALEGWLAEVVAAFQEVNDRADRDEGSSGISDADWDKMLQAKAMIDSGQELEAAGSLLKELDKRLEEVYLT